MNYKIDSLTGRSAVYISSKSVAEMQVKSYKGVNPILIRTIVLTEGDKTFPMILIYSRKFPLCHISTITCKSVLSRFSCICILE